MTNLNPPKLPLEVFAGEDRIRLIVSPTTKKLLIRGVF
jgi:hypothetical protein